MNISDWLVIVAILLGPILAVQVQKSLEKRKKNKERKLKLFKTLMATRATPIDPRHVEALNLIDIEFSKDRAVIEAWRSLLDNYSDYPKDQKDTQYAIRLQMATDKSGELLANLLFVMGKLLKYGFDKVTLKKAVYNPRGHVDASIEGQIIRQGLVQILSGRAGFPVIIINPPIKGAPNHESAEASGPGREPGPGS